MPVLPRRITPATRFWIIAVAIMTFFALAVCLFFAVGRLHPRPGPRPRPRARKLYSIPGCYSFSSFTERFKQRSTMQSNPPMVASNLRDAVTYRPSRPTIPPPARVRDTRSSEATLCSWSPQAAPSKSGGAGSTRVARHGSRRPLKPILQTAPTRSTRQGSSGRRPAVSWVSADLNRALPPLPK